MLSGGIQSASERSGAAGVMLTVRSGYAGTWNDIARDALGRAVAATLVASNGISLRFLAVYGPVAFIARSGMFSLQNIWRLCVCVARKRWFSRANRDYV